MIIVLFVVFILMIIFGSIMVEKTCSEWIEFAGCGCALMGVICEITTIIAIVALCINISKSRVIDQKITMYKEENKNIEEQVTMVVNSYKDYEKEVISNAGQMATILVRFPELKSNDLVKKQMDVYIKNNDKIKNLKEEKIDYQIYKWWLYFGE